MLIANDKSLNKMITLNLKTTKSIFHYSERRKKLLKLSWNKFKTQWTPVSIASTLLWTSVSIRLSMFMKPYIAMKQMKKYGNILMKPDNEKKKHKVFSTWVISKLFNAEILSYVIYNIGTNLHKKKTYTDYNFIHSCYVI